MSFFSKLVKGVGKAVGGIAKVATGLVSKLNIPILSGAAGIASSLLSGSGSNQPQTLTFNQPIAPPPQTAAQAATFGGTVKVNIPTGQQTFWNEKIEIFGLLVYKWIAVLLVPGIVVLTIGYFIFKRRRR
jgi:hypothetical protein